jgi:hypothetical protein
MKDKLSLYSNTGFENLESPSAFQNHDIQQSGKVIFDEL